jgi:hypothetical protein
MPRLPQSFLDNRGADGVLINHKNGQVAVVHTKGLLHCEKLDKQFHANLHNHCAAQQSGWWYHEFSHFAVCTQRICAFDGTVGML